MFLSAVIIFLYLSMSKEKKQVKITKRDKADKIKECEDKLLEIDLEKATKKIEIDSFDQEDPMQQQKQRKIQSEIFELDKKTRWYSDRIKMLNNVVS